MIEIRNAEEAHISALAEIERAAAELFSELDLPPHLRNGTVSEQEHRAAQRQGLLLVAIEDDFKPVGFAITTRVDSNLHLLEIDVHPQYQRKSKRKDLIRNGVWPCERSYEKEPMPLEQID